MKKKKGREVVQSLLSEFESAAIKRGVRLEVIADLELIQLAKPNEVLGLQRYVEKLRRQVKE